MGGSISTRTDHRPGPGVFGDTAPRHDQHVKTFHAYQAWLRRPWTWRNRLAWCLNQFTRFLTWINPPQGATPHD